MDALMVALMDALMVALMDARSDKGSGVGSLMVAPER